MKFSKMPNINFKKIFLITFIFLWNLHYIFMFHNLSTQNYLLEAFVTLLIHVYYLHLNIEYMTIIYFSILINRVTYSSFYAFSTITIMSISVKRSNFTSDYLKAVIRANPGAKRNFAGSSSYILIHIFLKFWNISAYNNVLFWANKSWHSHKFS